jgi:hypothetical protein
MTNSKLLKPYLIDLSFQPRYRRPRQVNRVLMAVAAATMAAAVTAVVLHHIRK